MTPDASIVGLGNCRPAKLMLSALLSKLNFTVNLGTVFRKIKVRLLKLVVLVS